MRDRRMVLFLIAGLLAGWLVAPRVAGAVGSLVTIQNSAGSQKAGVTKAKQLQVAESAPSTFHEFRLATTDTSCHVIATIPSNKGFVVRTIVFNVADESTGGIDVVLLHPNGTCAGNDIFSTSTRIPGIDTINLEPGFGVAAGGKLSIRNAGAGGVGVYVLGYFVPKGDVPATTPLN